MKINDDVAGHSPQLALSGTMPSMTRESAGRLNPRVEATQFLPTS
jgi:hypothetical protein